MNYAFSFSHDDLVVETRWLGELTGELIAAGVVSRMNWIHENSKKIPLVLLSDYTNADLEKITTSNLRMIASLFRSIMDQSPGIH
jgi:hypothetical protein